MDLKERIWKALGADCKWKGYFVTAEIAREGEKFPSTLIRFVEDKWIKITSQHISARRFVFLEGQWRLYITFFPTDTVVDEKYALKNKVMFR